MLRRALLAASASTRLRQLITTAPQTRAIVEKYVAGETADDAVRVTRALQAAGLLVSLDYLGEDTKDPAQAAAVTDEYIQLAGKLGAEGLSQGGAAEISVKPTAVGLFLGTRTAKENISRICAAAREAGTTVTLDAEEFAAIEPTLRIAGQLRAEYGDLGCVIQACLRRSEADCRALAGYGTRVRLCKGAYSEQDSVAFTSRREIDRSYARCLRALMNGSGYPDAGQPRPAADRDHRVAGPAHRACPGQLRVPDALRHPAGRATPAGRHRRADARLRPLRRRLVRLPGAQAGRTTAEPGFLPPLAGTGKVAPVIAILGTGKMGEALLSGLLRAGRPPSAVVAAVRREDRAAELRERYGTQVTDAAAAAKMADTLVLAVKPQDMGRLLDEIAPAVPEGTLVISVAAGITTAFISRRLSGQVPVVRVMSNTPVLVDEAMSVISAGAHAGEEHLRRAEELLRPVGKVLRIPESQQDAATALSGSGPAYVYYLVESMVDAGILLGMARGTALEMVIQAVYGAATMLRESGEHPVILREAVTSPGGTTISAIRELEKHGVRAAFLAAIEAARDRGRELGAD